jgi:hypothetical protein
MDKTKSISILSYFEYAGWLFLRAVESANKEAERQDKLDGF